MNFDELPTINRLKQNLIGFKYLFKIYLFFEKIGIKNKKIDEAKKQFEQLSEAVEAHTLYTTKFNRIFSEDGWIVHDSINHNLIKDADKRGRFYFKVIRCRVFVNSQYYMQNTYTIDYFLTYYQ